MCSVTGSILIVDDSAFIRDALQISLQMAGHEVKTAADGQEALACLAANSFDLLLLDIMMPRMNGYEVLEKIRANPDLAHLPVIVISANDQLDSAIRCIDLGAEDYLSKPINSTLLKARVNACLLKKRYHDQQAAYRQELECLYNEVQKANQAKSEFVALVAHELRSPMSTLWAYSDLLKRLGPLNERQDTTLANMRINLVRMRDLVADLDDVSRIETGHLRLEFEEVDIHELFELVLETMRHEINNRQHTVTMDVADGLAPLWGDRFRLTQILTNIIGNAIKYTPPNGRITLTAAAYATDSTLAQISVRDNGYGISDEEQEQLFTKFFRSADADIRALPGTGLGLHITRNLVEKHDGRIWCESKLGHGTTFYLTIPLSEMSRMDWLAAELGATVPADLMTTA